MGPEVEREVVRAMVLLRARSLAMGCSGARPEVAAGLIAMLNAGLTPVVHEHGSLGASGDLAPLAEAALALIGEGELRDASGAVRPAPEALAAAGLDPVTLRAKEGLALINGTDGILGMLVLALADLRRLLQVADITGAMSVEALLGTDRAFAADLQALRPQPGQAVSAANLRRLLAGSAIVASHRDGDPRVQDAYSLRCTPQVHGAARDTVAHAERVAGHELVSAIDNPMILPDGRVESCGNFHGAPLAYACDFLAIAVADVGAIVERRTDRLLDRTRSHGLPPFLAPGRGGGLRPDDRPLRPGRDGGREPPPGHAGLRRHHPDQRHAGGPRVDGVGCRPQAPPGRRQPGPHPGRRAHLRGPRAGPPGAADAGARDGRGAGRRAVGGGRAGPGPLAVARAGGGRGCW